MKKAFILGATSAIAQGAARAFAEDGASLFLVARDGKKLDAVMADLRAAGAARVEGAVADLNDLSRHAELVEKADRFLEGFDAVLVAHGELGDQKACERDFAEAERVFRTNFLSAASILSLAANRLEARGRGCLAAISSVAGDRGRAGNYVYGASKAALSAFLQGLRARLHRSGVRVVTVKPGFVDTPMTAGLRKNFLFARADAVGRAVHAAMKAGRDVVYLPWFWRPILFAVRSVPERLFKRLRA